MASINTAWINNITKQIDAIPDCASLQALIDQVVAQMNAQIAGMERQVEALLPLITIPTSLGEVISFCTAQVSFYLAQYDQALAAEIALVAAYTNLISAMTTKISELKCSITPPTPPIL
jgi:hypothetical protein